MDKIGKAFRAVAASIGGIGLVLAAASNLQQFAGLLNTAYWVVLSVAWVLAVAAVWPSEKRQPIGFRAPARPAFLARFAQYKWVLAISLAFAAAAIWRGYEIRYPRSLDRHEPLVRPDEPIPVGMRTDQVNFVEFVIDHGKEAAPPEVVALGMSEEKTSYEEADEIDGAPAFRLPERFHAEEGTEDQVTSDRWDGCNQYVRDPRVVQALRRFVRREDRERLLPYMSDARALDRLVRRRAAVLRQIIPSGAEWGEVAAASDRHVILGWLRQCVGLVQPVFSLTLRNRSDRPVAVTGVTYRVLGGDAGCGGSGPIMAPLVSTAIYPHRLDPIYHNNPSAHRSSVQYRRLNPPFRLPPNDLETFELHVYPSDGYKQRQIAHMVMDLHTTDGIVRTPDFWVDFPLADAC